MLVCTFPISARSNILSWSSKRPYESEKSSSSFTDSTDGEFLQEKKQTETTIIHAAIFFIMRPA